MKPGTITALAALSLHGTLLYAQGHAHVHGAATLQVTLDGPTLTLLLRTPLENLVGFEHAPRTEQQKKALRQLEESLRRPAQHFRLAPAAECKAVSTRLDSPVLDGATGKGSTQGEHAELTAEYTFRCEAPERLQSLELALFDGFRRMQRVEVQWAGPQGQKAFRLSPRQRVARW